MSEKKEPIVKTLEDKGTKIDWVKLPDGREMFIFQEEKFRGIQIAGFKLGKTDKYRIISPAALTSSTINRLSQVVTEVSGSAISPSDISVIIGEEKASIMEKSEKLKEE